MSSSGMAFDILERSHRLHQELLARRLAAAKSQHDAALDALRRVIDDNQAAAALHPDGWREILEVRFAEADALAEYISALRAFSALNGGSSTVVA